MRNSPKRVPWREDHYHLTAFHRRELFDLGELVRIRLHPFENGGPKLLMSQFTTSEAEGNLNLVAFLEELNHRAHFYAVIMIVDVRAEFDFLDLDRLLLFARFILALLFFVFVLAVIEYLAYRWIRVWRKLQQV